MFKEIVPIVLASTEGAVLGYAINPNYGLIVGALCGLTISGTEKISSIIFSRLRWKT